MDRRTRICIWIILVGLMNFLIYAVLYMFINGEAIHGAIQTNADRSLTYLVLSPGGDYVPVSGAVFIYSGVHSISIWLTVGAIMLAMLTLAKERIASSMRSAIIRGRTLITVLATVITMIVVLMTVWFTLYFCTSLTHPRIVGAPSDSQPMVSNEPNRR